MVKFTVDELRAIMSQQDRIRNISVIAHVDHGKSTLTDSLIYRAGMLAESKAGSSTYLDGREDEKTRGITIKSSGISLGFDFAGSSYLVNLIDSPGHVDFSSEVTAALRVTDGAIVVVDCVEGICVQTETVLRQALLEKVRPVLMINKLDRFILELEQDPEQMYQAFLKIIQSANSLIGAYADPVMGDLNLDPIIGNVGFGSGKMCWGFTLKDFARMYASQYSLDEQTVLGKLWGEWYFDPKTNKWVSHAFSEDGTRLERTFCKFVLKPIMRVCKDIKNIDRLLRVLGVTLKQEERERPEKELIKLVMQRWIPLSESLLSMITTHLPSPQESQIYRAQHLYTGPLEDDTARAIMQCDLNGPAIVFVSKMIPSAGTFIGFGRVFSGTIRSGMRVKIMAPQVFYKNIQKAVVVMGTTFETVEDVPCGNTIGIVGVDGCLTKSGTISSSEDAFPIKPMQFSVSPVVRVAVRPRNPADIGKLIKGIDRLNKSDPLLVCSKDASGELIISGCGELHIEIALNDLREFSKIELAVSDPVVPYQESILSESSVILAKSQNKHNRVYIKATPLHEETMDMLEKGQSLNDKSIWAFSGLNTISNNSRGVNYIQEVRDSICTGFQTAASEGILCGEPMRGVNFSLEDGLFHSDNAHRGGNQVISAARKACYGAYLTGNPCLYEPVYLVSVQCTESAIGGTYNVLNMRRAEVISQEVDETSQLVIVQAYLPVVESFGFNADLRAATAGQAFPQCVFSHWQSMGGSPLEDGTRTNAIVKEVRTRKGLKAELPVLADFSDKL